MDSRPKRLPVPFKPSNFRLVCPEDQPSTKATTEYTEKNPEAFARDAEVEPKVIAELEGLLEMSRDQLGLLQERVQVLKCLVNDGFGIENPEKWHAEQQAAAEPKARETKPITLTIPTDVAKTGTAAPTTLRIKLVDPKPTSAPSAPAVGRGAGSKNLSRMNRPQDEATKAKAASQIPISVFWNQVEPFFKPIEEADMKFLGDPSRILDPSPFIIPPLGKPFREQWQHQYGYVSTGSGKGSASAMLPGGSDQYKPTLKERLLSMLIDEGLVVDQPMDIDPVTTNEGGEEQPEQEAAVEYTPTNMRADYIHIDERLRRELSNAGIEDFANCSTEYQEDDPICTELRSLQRQLQEQVAVNYYRKRKLSELAKTKLAAQEFYSLLADLDKQLEQVFLKRTKSGKKKKKTTTSSGNVGLETPGSAVPPEAVRLLENRAKLISAFAPYIPKLPEFLASQESHLIEPTEEAQVIQVADQTGNWLQLPYAAGHIETEFTKPLPYTQPVFPN